MLQQKKFKRGDWVTVTNLWYSLSMEKGSQLTGKIGLVYQIDVIIGNQCEIPYSLQRGAGYPMWFFHWNLRKATKSEIYNHIKQYAGLLYHGYDRITTCTLKKEYYETKIQNR